MDAQGKAIAMYRIKNSLEKFPRSSGGIGTLEAQELAAPVLPDWWPGEPEFAGLVPREDQQKNMVITVPPWPNGAPAPAFSDVFRFQYRRSDIPTWSDAQEDRIPGPTLPGGPPKQITFKSENFPGHGVYLLRYTVRTYNNILGESFEVSFIIDQQAPNYGGQSPDPLTFRDDALIKATGVTGKYLDANNNQLPVVIPLYHDEQPGDTVQIFLGATFPDPDGTPAYDGPYDPVTREVLIPGDRLRALDDGRLYVTYRLVDKVTNRGQASDPVVVDLLIKPLPQEPLPAPRVTGAEDSDTQVNLEDLRAGRDSVLIPRYTEWQNNDRIVVTWGGIDLNAYVVSNPADPIEIKVPYSVISSAFGASDVPVSTPVTYRVERGRRAFGADVTTVDVDLYVPGPENPDRPDPINPNLKRVTVRGGGPAPEVNKINADDVGLPATATVTLHDPIVAGSRLRLYWGNFDNLAAEYLPTAADGGNPYTFTVPWDVIDKGPAAIDVPVFYTLDRVTGGNYEIAPATPVDVTEAVVVALASPTFPEADVMNDGVTPILNCRSFVGSDHHLNVHIPPNSGALAVGDEIKVVVQGYSDYLGTQPAGTEWTTTITLTAAQVDQGFTLAVAPYDDHLLPIGLLGLVKATYATTSAPVKLGQSEIYASTTTPGGTCFPPFLLSPPATSGLRP